MENTVMFSQVNDDFEDSPRTPTTQRSITQRPGDSSGPGANHVRPLFWPKPLHSQVLWHPPISHPRYGGQEEKQSQGGSGSTSRRTQYRCCKKTQETHLSWSLRFSDGDWRCPSASSKIPDWAPYLPGGLIFKALVENTAGAFYSGTSGIEAAPNSGPKSKWGSYSEAARREIQRNDEKPGKSRWYYFVLF